MRSLAKNSFNSSPSTLSFLKSPKTSYGKHAVGSFLKNGISISYLADGLLAGFIVSIIAQISLKSLSWGSNSLYRGAFTT